MKNNKLSKRISYATVFLILSMIITTVAVKAPEKNVDSNSKLKSNDLEEELEVRSNVLVEDELPQSPKTDDKTPFYSSNNNKEPVKPQYIVPVNGEIIFDYSMDKQVYSKTMDDYRTHRGVDISAKQGENIKAVESGTVAFAGPDDLMGETVKIKHADESVSVYSGLQSTSSLVEGQSIKKGETIGTAGGNIPLEALEDVHIHFELIIDNQYVDPTEHITN